MADKPEERPAFIETAAPEAGKDGVAMSGKFPLNHRLRAEALAKAKKDADPDGIVDADAIKEGAKRNARREKAEAKADAKNETTPADAGAASKGA